MKSEDINKTSFLLPGKRTIGLDFIYGLDLKKDALVTLSSCNTAFGIENPGREFASLASPFTMAGASSVIASLWKVDDRATSKLFKAFRELTTAPVPPVTVREIALFVTVRANIDGIETLVVFSDSVHNHLIYVLFLRLPSLDY